MGVYINMEMPKSCDECTFCDGEAWCLIPGDWRLRYNIAHGERLSTCPLVNVPPHGRCIDADKLMQEMRLFIKENMLSRDDARELLETIEDASTIIPPKEE